MALTSDDLNAFHRFAQYRVQLGGVDSLYELADLWALEHPTSERLSDDVAAVRAAVIDMQKGDQGRPGAELIAELRHELGSSDAK